MIVKKYSNRRLYDTEESRYITLEELTDKVRRGTDVEIIDAKSGEDLTQQTLTQIILETKAARLLPTPLLARLIRMQDDALGEFFGKYVSAALELYLSAKQGAQAVSPYFPFATVPFSAGNAFARLLNGIPSWSDALGGSPDKAPPGAAAPPPPAPREVVGKGDLDALRSELEELKKEMRRKRR
jgi:polyhydroxyalkanoate synthesis repressor PhaR